MLFSKVSETFININMHFKKKLVLKRINKAPREFFVAKH